MKKVIYLDDAISAIKSLYNILGVCGTKAAVMVLENVPEANSSPLLTLEKSKCDTKNANVYKNS